MMIATPRPTILITGDDDLLAHADRACAGFTKVGLFDHGERNPDLGPLVECLECRSPTGQINVVHDRHHTNLPRTMTTTSPSQMACADGESAAVASIHRDAEKGSSRKLKDQKGGIPKTAVFDTGVS